MLLTSLLLVAEAPTPVGPPTPVVVPVADITVAAAPAPSHRPLRQRQLVPRAICPSFPGQTLRLSDDLGGLGFLGDFDFCLTFCRPHRLAIL